MLGPGSQPLPIEANVLITAAGTAARYLVILDSEPLGADAVAAVDRLQPQLPATARRSRAGGHALRSGR